LFAIVAITGAAALHHGVLINADAAPTAALSFLLAMASKVVVVTICCAAPWHLQC